MIGFVSSRTGRVMPMEFQTAEGIREVTLPCRVTANEAETAHHLARMGPAIASGRIWREATL